MSRLGKTELLQAVSESVIVMGERHRAVAEQQKARAIEMGVTAREMGNSAIEMGKRPPRPPNLDY